MHNHQLNHIRPIRICQLGFPGIIAPGAHIQKNLWAVIRIPLAERAVDYHADREGTAVIYGNTVSDAIHHVRTRPEPLHADRKKIVEDLK